MLNYADLDPECVRTVETVCSQNSSQANFSLSLNTPSLALIFHVPKPDMRDPHDIGPDFIGAFWTRKIHPELFNFQLEDFGLKVSQDGGSLAPLHINLSSTSVEINYQEGPLENTFPIIQARRLLDPADKTKKSFAVEIDITVCILLVMVN